MPIEGATYPPEIARSVIVCGSSFGQVYLEAIRSDPTKRLLGILARDSPRSLACGRYYDVPVFRSVAELPQADIACVVVRGALLGGPGTEIARQLMARGIHVLQEHPVHQDELAGSLRIARKCKVTYHLNTFYPHLAEVRRFLRAGKTLLRTRKPLYIHAACSFQVAYALFDILRLLMGSLRPWEFHAATRPLTQSHDQKNLLRTLEGKFAGVPLSLGIQNQIHPVNPDDFAYLLHRITLGTDGGELTLATTHGPVVLCARPAIPREVLDPGLSTPYASEDFGPRDSLCTTMLSSGELPSQRRLFREDWPAAARRAIDHLCRSITEADNSMEIGQHHLGLCRVWQGIVGEIGVPDLLHDVGMPAALSLTELEDLRRAAADEYSAAVSA